MRHRYNIDDAARKRGCLTISMLRERWGLRADGPILRLIKNGPLEATKEGGIYFITLQSVEDAEDCGEKPRPKRSRFSKHRGNGFLVAEAFRMFQRNMSLADVVMRLHVTPDVVDKWYAEFRNSDMRRRYEDRIRS